METGIEDAWHMGKHGIGIGMVEEHAEGFRWNMCYALGVLVDIWERRLGTGD